MCCFSRTVPFVGQTQIFVRAADDGREFLAYSMSVDIPEELAMVLPLPVPHGAGEDAVAFIDLSGYASFFSDLARAFPSSSEGHRARGAEPKRDSRKLAVHDVGDFEASFVPSVRDFARLDERFRMPSSFFASLPAYAGDGFAVFRLKPRRSVFGALRRQTVHPMALSFPRRDTSALFYPTVHVHDETVHAKATFDHTLYCQPTSLLAALMNWTESTGPIDRFVDVERTHGLVAEDAHALTLGLQGLLPNEDMWLREPPGVSVADLAGGGECHAYRVAAMQAFTPVDFHDMSPAWRDTARHKLPALCRGLREGLRELEATHRASLGMAPLSDELAPHFINGTELWSGTSFMDGRPHTGGGPGYVRFTPYTKHVELQSVTIGFSELPTREGVGRILHALEGILDRAVAGPA